MRTSLQHLWAEMSEKFSDVLDPAIKYGGGDETLRFVLTTSSELIATTEDAERKLLDSLARIPREDEPRENIKVLIAESREALISAKQMFFELFEAGRNTIAKLKEERNDISD